MTQARTTAMANNGPPQSQAGDENELVQGLRQLFAVAENYPDLKANQNFLALQTELANTEDRIQRSRRFYNANVRRLSKPPTEFPVQSCGPHFRLPRSESSLKSRTFCSTRRR